MSASPEPAARGLRLAAAALLAAALAAAVYGSFLSGPFLYDDLPYVRDNTFVQTPRNLGHLWTTAYMPSRPELGLYRPVTSTTYLINFSLSGFSTTGFHLTNTILHMAASALCVWVVVAAGASLTAATIAGALFALHPLHTEAVAWIVGRAEVLAALGCFGAFLAWIPGRRRGSPLLQGVAFLLYFLALGAKETAAPLPVALIAHEWLVHRTPRDTREGKRPWFRRLAPYAGFAVAFAIYAVLRVHAIGRFSGIEAITAFVGQPPIVRTASALAVMGEYVRLCLVPVNLRLDYADLTVGTLAAPSVLFGMLSIAALLTCALLLYRKQPVVTFWIAWFCAFVLMLSPALLPIGAVLAERFAYIASLAPCALAGMGFAWLIDRQRRAALRVATAVASIALIVWFGSATVARARDWQDALDLFVTEVRRSPHSEKAHLNLAAELWDRGKRQHAGSALRDAEQAFREGIDLGQRRTPARTLTGDHVRLVYSYGNFLQEQGRADEALRQYEQVASLLRQYPALAPYVEADFHVWYGAALEAKGREDAAIEQYRSALAQRPGWLVPLRNIAQTLMHLNRTEEAITAYRQALAADPMFSIGYVNLALCLSRVQKHDEAVATLATFTRIVPETAENAYYRGFIAQHLNLIEQARQAYRRALELDPSREDAQRALGSLGRAG